MAHYLITGHTGFKGSWLTLLLKAQGHEVSGIALDPPQESLFVKAGLSEDLVHDFRQDIRDRDGTIRAFQKVQPDLVIHLAAQALVLEGYRNPIETYETNVNGTLNVLEASDRTDSVRAQLIVTTDKVYEDRGLNRPYVETDPLGGKDPYSASKAMADILAQEWLARTGAKPGAIARAGNVVGAGDYSPNRLIPDFVRAAQGRSSVRVRNPRASRPWQHVLDCLGGYLGLLTAVDSGAQNGEWNFGPKGEDSLEVWQLIDVMRELVRTDVEVSMSGDSQNKEATFLALDSSKAFSHLGWECRFNVREAAQLSLAEIVSDSRESLRSTVLGQIEDFGGFGKDTKPKNRVH